MFITISELKVQKVVVDNQEMTIETEDKAAKFLTPLNKKLDIPEPTTSNQNQRRGYQTKSPDVSVAGAAQESKYLFLPDWHL